MKKLLALLVFALALTAGDTTPGFAPSSETAVVTNTVRLRHLHLANTTSGAVTFTIKDRSTNCSAAACQLWPTVSVAANTVYEVEFLGLPATSGFTVQASAGTSLLYWISYQ